MPYQIHKSYFWKKLVQKVQSAGSEAKEGDKSPLNILLSFSNWAGPHDLQPVLVWFQTLRNVQLFILLVLCCSVSVSLSLSESADVPSRSDNLEYTVATISTSTDHIGVALWGERFTDFFNAHGLFLSGMKLLSKLSDPLLVTVTPLKMAASPHVSAFQRCKMVTDEYFSIEAQGRQHNFDTSLRYI